MSNFSPSFKFKICQQFKISQPKVINCHLIGDFCLANFKFVTDFKFKTRRYYKISKRFKEITILWYLRLEAFLKAFHKKAPTKSLYIIWIMF